MEKFKICIINPGSTSDEISYYIGDEEIFHKTTRYSPSDLAKYDGKEVMSQYKFRFDLIINVFKDNNIPIKEIDAVIGRGGLTRPIPSGTFKVDQDLIKDLKSGEFGEHSSNLGAILADSLSKEIKKNYGKTIPSFIADSVVVDEMWDIAKYSGMPENPRLSILHALNQKSVARLVAKKLKKKYQDLNLIIAHGGGGISIGLHKKGRVVDVNNALDGEGPFTPQRSGGVPVGGLAKMCFSGKYSYDEIKLKIKGRGGIVAYIGTSDLILLEDFVLGKELSKKEKSQIKEGITKEKTEEIMKAMIYQVAKSIGALAAALGKRPDAIVFTGGIGYCDFLVEFLKEKVEWIAPVFVYPGGDEMQALKNAAERVLKGEEKEKIYSEYI